MWFLNSFSVLKTLSCMKTRESTSNFRLTIRRSYRQIIYYKETGAPNHFPTSQTSSEYEKCCSKRAITYFHFGLIQKLNQLRAIASPKKSYWQNQKLENEKGTLKITNNAQQIVCDEMAAVGIKCISCTSGAVGSSKVDIINEKRQSHVYYMLLIE